MRHFIRKSLLQLTFSGAYLMRWNDKLRPVELVEIDKQAHKMLLTCILWQQYTSAHTNDGCDRTDLAREIIEGGLFDYFYRLVITDIKPPVFYRIKENAKDYVKLTEHVLNELRPLFSGADDQDVKNSFWERMCSWHRTGERNTVAQRILSAAHLFASQWEFKLLAPLNPFDDEIDDIARSFEDKLSSYADLPGMNKILTQGTALSKLANLCGQLRFQIRWTRAPRIPATSVLGHMFIVAALSYFFSLSLRTCQARANNNFFCGLFHDLPELLTRDIISPVKQSVPNLPNIIKKYENDELERRIFRPLRLEGAGSLVEQISYYLGLDVGSEFYECCRENGKIKRIADFETLERQYNADALDPKDGVLLKICDWLAAFMEAHNSIRTGVSSPQLLEARTRLKTLLQEKGLPCLKLDTLLADFD